MKLMLFTTSLDIGGTEKQVSALASGIKIPCIVVCLLKPKNEFHSINICQAGIKLYHLNVKRIQDVFVAFFKLIQITKQEKVVLISAFLFPAFMMARFVKLFIRVKVVSNHRCIEKRKFRNWIDKMTKFLSDGEIVNSNEVCEHILKTTY